jgi:hypothetical protein
MSRKIGTIVLSILCIVLLFPNSGAVLAQADEPAASDSQAAVMPGIIIVSPMSQYYANTVTYLSIGPYGEATVSGRLTGYPGVTDEVWIYLYLQRYVNGTWQNFNSWSATFYSYAGYLEGYDVVPHGYYYRVKASYYAWSGSNYEHSYGYSSTLYY